MSSGYEHKRQGISPRTKKQYVPDSTELRTIIDQYITEVSVTTFLHKQKVLMRGRVKTFDEVSDCEMFNCASRDILPLVKISFF
jgi:hypothetical protein